MEDRALTHAASPLLDPPDPAHIARLLQRTPLFALVEQEILERLAAAARLVQAPAGAVLIRQGEIGSEAFLLVAGIVDIVVEFEGLGRIRISEARPFDIIGETGALCHSPRTTSVVAREAVTMLSIHQTDLESLTAHHPEVALAILQTVAARLHHAGRHLACLISAARALREGSATIDAVGRMLRAETDFAPYAEAIEVVAGQIARNEALRQEMEAAARIQQSILPHTMAWRGTAAFAEIAASMRPARHVGGDFYDYFLISEDRIAVVVGDVSGKGVPAALFMTLARNAFRMVARSESSPARVLAAVNRMLCEGNDDLLFLTSVYGTVDRWTGEFTYGIGGHDAPLLMRGADGAIELEPTGDMVLGIEEGLEFSQKSVTLAPDDLLLVYTDGVTEAQSETDTLFGRQRLRDLLAQARQDSAAALIEEVNRAVDSFTSTVAQADDIACLALRLIQAPTRRTAPAESPATLDLRLAGGLDELQRMAAALQGFGADLELPPAAVGELTLALEELVGNTLIHGYGSPAEGVVYVRIKFEPGWLTATLRDTASPYNPLSTAAADIDLELEERKIGGLGVHLARNLTDEIRYRYHSGQNVLTVRKRVSAEAAH